MRLISDIFSKNVELAVHSIDTGDRSTQKTSPDMQMERVPQDELENTYIINPIVFNSINKTVQTIMNLKHFIKANDEKVQMFFNRFIENLGNSGSDITWDEILTRIFQDQCVHGWAWIENIYNVKGNRIVDWDIVDPKQMDYAKDALQKVVVDKDGKPVGYFQILPYTGTQYHQKTYVLPFNVSPPNNPYVFLSPSQIALIKLYTVGNGFYPIGLVEPIYKSSLRKLNIESASANSIYRVGFPILWAQLGDTQHEPQPQQITNMLDKLKNMTNKTEIVTPWYHSLKLLEGKKVDKIQNYMDYFVDNEVAGIGIPKPYATGGGEACYSEDTLTLTERGWKYHWEITADDKIATYNPENGNMEFHNYTHKELFYYEGEMHHYLSSVYDILVTPKHKMFYRTERKDEWVKLPSEEIKEECIRFKNTVSFIGNNAEIFSVPKMDYDQQARQNQDQIVSFPIKPFLKFLGFYISEGWCEIKNGQYPIELSNLNPNIIDEMKDSLNVMGISYRYKISRKRIEGIRCNHKSLAIWLKTLCGHISQEKQIPKEILELNPELLEILLDALVKGDGDTWGTTGISYQTSSKKLFSQVCEIMLKCGYAVSYNDYILKHGIYRINGNKTHIEPRVRRHKNLIIEDYKGMVYCYEVPNHLYITARNGKITIQGNTNRATLAFQDTMFHLTLNDIIKRTSASIRKYMFRPICELEGFSEVPHLIWEEGDTEEVDTKANRIVSYVKVGLINPALPAAEIVKRAKELENG